MELAQYKRKRGNIKSSLTKFSTYIETQTNNQLSQFKLRLDRAEQLLDKFEEVQEAIENLDETEVEESEETRKAFEEDYYATIGKARDIIKKHNTLEQKDIQDGSLSTNIKLPTLTLPRFDGNYAQWLSFKDSYTSAIHNNNKLTYTEKFRYLRSSLHGEALHLIAALETSDENYTIAWNMLKDRYENQRLIIHTHLKSLFELPVLHKESYLLLRQTIDKAMTHIMALKALGEPVGTWHTILIHLLTGKLDTRTKCLWETEVGETFKNERAELNDFVEFLSNRCQILEITDKVVKQPEKASPAKGNVTLTSTTTTLACAMCKDNHNIFRCGKFLKLAPAERTNKVKQLHLCLNCLKKGHYVNNCKSEHKCKNCQKTHNTLLHQDRETRPTTPEAATTVVNCITNKFTQVLLATAVIQIEDAHGKLHQARALLDNGSQSNFITQNLCKKLSLNMNKIQFNISGVGQAMSNIKFKTAFTYHSLDNTYQAAINCLVLNRITEPLPTMSFNKSIIEIPDDVELADPNFFETGDVDVLLGAVEFWQILRNGTLRLQDITLQNTSLGYIVTGGLALEPNRTSINCLSIDTTMERFWQIEDCQHKPHNWSKEEQYCIDHYQKTYRRNEEGRYIVSLLRKENVVLGNSLETARKRFLYMENKLNMDQKLKEQYIHFMREYEFLSHMSELPISDANSKYCIFLPHHPVIKQESLTTKVRVVFDGSCKSSNGLSLNDSLVAGPTVQSELLDIILRFRTHQYVISADISMMFRQILIKQEDRSYQQICWRESVDEPIKFYTLNTVTYGTTSAPFLAAQTLQQLAHDEGDNYPIAKEVLQNDFYMDDVLTGTNSLQDTIVLQKQLDNLLASGCFKLRKWRANNEKILSHLSSESKAKEMLVIQGEGPVKTLGLLWNSTTDNITYSIKANKAANEFITKRHILSRISTIFDPLGLLGPIIIKAKIFMQKLWQLDLHWDDEVPPDIRNSWLAYSARLLDILDLKIPRNINENNKSEKFDMFGFCDASERAYGACVYAVYEDTFGQINSKLICAKSRVAPIKVITIPRLELCGALLLSRLVETVRRVLKNKIRNTYLWTDSTIVLAWIRTPSNSLKTFVSNRVSEIQSLTSEYIWQHVNGSDNPADILSRGIEAPELLTSELWWNGPCWMRERMWPEQQPSQLYTTNEEHKQTFLTLLTREKSFILTRYSSYDKLLRITAYCLRWKNCLLKTSKERLRELEVRELEEAEMRIISLVQEEAFENELKELRKGNVSRNSKITNLNPYIDEKSMIRVGGRLEHANVPEQHKHPYLLPSDHHVTRIIIKGEHERLLHCGHEQLLSSIRTRFWPISGRRIAKKIVHECLICFYARPKAHNHQMGNLPKERVHEGKRPFTVVGMDYAGPISLKQSKTRGKLKIAKGYVALFICFATKAIHLELVSDLTTPGFLAALRRFVARRGLCERIYCDNATNFVGAQNALKDVYKFLSTNRTDIGNLLASQKIEWHFIPPRAPHFGGLWEASIKSMKRHLLKITKNVPLTFEETYTLLTQIEAVMNSRPLMPLSSDPNDLNPLTPSHFLIGDRLLEPPTNLYTNIPNNRLSRWEHLSKLNQHFWNRWRKEYLHNLQVRSKWTQTHANIQVGDLVILMEENQPPLHWLTGRVIEVHPGPDGVVRVVSVKCAKGVFKRPVKKVCLFPN